MNTREQFSGLATREVIKILVRNNKDIASIMIRAYLYVPMKPSMEDDIVKMLTREEFLDDKTLDSFIEALEDGWNVAIGSVVTLQDGRKAHIPMLDLAPRKSSDSLQNIIQRLQDILVPSFGGGMILESKQSYQYIGFDVFEEKLFKEFLGRSLITSIVIKTSDEIPNIHEHIVDYRYVGYSLMRDNTGLRITARGDKDFMPKVVAVI